MRRRGFERVAVVGAVVPGRREHGLPLSDGLLEQEVLGLLQAGLSRLDGLLAQAPARADDLVAVGVDDRGVLVGGVVDHTVGAGLGPS